MASPPPEIPYEIVVRANDPQKTEVEELANFLRDLVFLHDRLWLIATDYSAKYNIGASFFYARDHRPVPHDQRLGMSFLRKESPLELAVIISSALAVPAAAWAYFQILRGRKLLPGELRLQQLQEKKLLAEIDSLAPAAQKPQSELTSIYNELKEEAHTTLERRELEVTLLQRDIERLSQDAFRITEIQVKQTVKYEPRQLKKE
jgi:hypothetical protein